MARGAGRFSKSSTNVGVEQLLTDSDGKFTTGGLWAKDQFQITVSAEGYSKFETPGLHAEMGKTQDLGSIKLQRIAATVQGKVIDSSGKPLAGVTLINAGDGPSKTSTTSAADGAFTLNGYYENQGFVFAQLEGFRLAHALAQPEGPAVTITLNRLTEPARFVPQVTAAHRKAVDAVARHLLNSLWKERAILGGYERNTYLGMATFDPQTAQQWLEEEPKVEAKKTYAKYLKDALRKKELFDQAKTDFDEALEALRESSGSTGFSDMTHLAKQLLSVDKAKALRVIEEAAIRARTMELPTRVWSLAEVGALAEEAGHQDSGKKLILEAAALAEKTGTEGLDTLARGYAARYLAVHDLQRAMKLIEGMRDADYNRWLTHVCYELAPLNPQQARQLLKQLKPDSSSSPQLAQLAVALRLAKQQPDEAEKMLDAMERSEYPIYGIMGLGKLAVVVAPHDQARAHRLIDKARLAFEPHPDAFQSWSNYGDKGVFAAQLALDAQQAGYPEMGSLVTWALMQRNSNSFYSSDTSQRDEHHLKQAMLLSFIDSTVARQAVETIGPSKVLVERGLLEKREWLFALALAAPETAPLLVDLHMKRVHDRPALLNRTGMIELISILNERNDPKRPSLHSFLSTLRLGTEPD